MFVALCIFHITFNLCWKYRVILQIVIFSVHCILTTLAHTLSYSFSFCGLNVPGGQLPRHCCWCSGSLHPLIARFMGPTWGPSGAYRTQVGPMLAQWSLLSGSRVLSNNRKYKYIRMFPILVSKSNNHIPGRMEFIGPHLNLNRVIPINLPCVARASAAMTLTVQKM